MNCHFSTIWKLNINLYPGILVLILDLFIVENDTAKVTRQVLRNSESKKAFPHQTGTP